VIPQPYRKIVKDSTVTTPTIKTPVVKTPVPKKSQDEFEF